MAILQRLNRRDCLPSNSCSGAAMPSHLWASRSSITEPINDALAEKSSPGHNLLIVGISVGENLRLCYRTFRFLLKSSSSRHRSRVPIDIRLLSYAAGPLLPSGLCGAQGSSAEAAVDALLCTTSKAQPLERLAQHARAQAIVLHVAVRRLVQVVAGLAAAGNSEEVLGTRVRLHGEAQVSSSPMVPSRARTPMHSHSPGTTLKSKGNRCVTLPSSSLTGNSGEYSPQIEMLPATPRDFLANEVTTRPACPPMSPSIAASSPILPLHSRRVTATTVSDADLGAETRSLRSAARDRVPQHRESRSSWNDERSSTLTRSPRQSAETSRASGGFRTVDSWVNNQSSRAEERRLKDRYRGEDVKEPVPELPEHFKRKTAALSRVPTVFRQHPGREVVFGRANSVSSRLSGHPISGGAKDS